MGLIISLVKETNSTRTDETKIATIEEYIKKIIAEINNATFVDHDDDKFFRQTSYLNSKININSKHHNTLAIKRDKLKLIRLELQKSYALTINKIIKGKTSFKDKKYFISVLNKMLLKLQEIDLKEHDKLYEKSKSNKDKVSKAYVKEYESTSTLLKTELLVFDYLISNMDQYRKSNILLDELSLHYIITQIDSLLGIAQLSEILHYYLGISIGEIIIATLIMLLAIFINRRLLRKIGIFSKRILEKRFPDTILVNYDYSTKTKSLMLYIFATQLCLYLIVDDFEILAKFQAIFNTTYISLLSYISYNFLIEYINTSSDRIFNKYPNMRKEMIDFVLRIAKIIIFAFILLFLLMQLGFDIKAVIASLGIGGIAVALAAKDTLSNFFGSLNIITDNSFSQGDWIKAGEVEGTVVDIRMRTTRIRTFANAMITVPNAQLANIAITNWSKRKVGRRIKMRLNITYTSKMEDIQNLVSDIREMLSHHKDIASINFEPKNIIRKNNLLKQEDLIGVKKTLLVYIDSYNTSSIDILVYCFTKSPDWEEWLKTKEDVIVQINTLLEKNKCDFAFPSQTIYLENIGDKED